MFGRGEPVSPSLNYAGNRICRGNHRFAIFPLKYQIKSPPGGYRESVAGHGGGGEEPLNCVAEVSWPPSLNYAVHRRRESKNSEKLIVNNC
jgi:hypothetical protein